MAKLVFVNKTGYGPMVFESGANHYRLIGLEITRSAGTGIVSHLITADKNAAVNHIVLDRLWVHGTSQDETTRGAYCSGITSIAVVDSFFTDFHCVSMTGVCIDAQAVAGGAGDIPTGTYKIVDNFLEASGENVIFGGSAVTITLADMEIRRNHLFKPLTWMPGHPGFVGGTDGNPFIVNNLFEIQERATSAVRTQCAGKQRGWGRTVRKRYCTHAKEPGVRNPECLPDLSGHGCNYPLLHDQSRRGSLCNRQPSVQCRRSSCRWRAL
jgi:hypothetical protein